MGGCGVSISTGRENKVLYSRRMEISSEVAERQRKRLGTFDRLSN